jgi:hypothetical protein
MPSRIIRKMQIYVGAVNYVIDYAVDADRILAQPSANISMTAIFYKVITESRFRHIVKFERATRP